MPYDPFPCLLIFLLQDICKNRRNTRQTTVSHHRIAYNRWQTESPMRRVLLLRKEPTTVKAGICRHLSTTITIEERAQRTAYVSKDDSLHHKRSVSQPINDSTSYMQSQETIGEILVKPPLASKRNGSDEAVPPKKYQETDQNQRQRLVKDLGSKQALPEDDQKENTNTAAAGARAAQNTSGGSPKAKLSHAS